MADIFTRVDDVYLCNGRKTRAEAIAEARKFMQHQRDLAETFLARTDKEISVTIVSGSIVQHVVKELLP
jgi:hypothetical protein